MTNLLSLEEFRRVLGWSPFHYWGLSDSQYTPIVAKCPSLLKQYSWQGTDAAGRAEITSAIEDAEGLLRDYLGYSVAPAYNEVTLPWPRYYDATRSRFANFDGTGRWIAPRLPFGNGQLQAIGVEALTVIGTATKSSPPVGGDTLVFTDADSDGLMDTFTITLATTQTDPEKVAVYFVAADRLDSDDAGERWRIRPVQAAISGGTATIIGRIWTIVRPILYEGINTQPLDPTVITPSGPYAQSLTVYTRTTDPDGSTIETSQAKLIWETEPCHGWWCCCGCQNATYDPAGSPRDPAAQAFAIGRAVIRDARSGLVGIGEAVLNATTGVWSAIPWDSWHEPDRVTVRFLAGQPLEAGAGAMSTKWRTIVARLAMAELARPVCACEAANRELYRWQEDVARSAGNNDAVFAYISSEDLSNPLGTRRGHIFAWRQVKNLRVTVASIDS